MEKPHFQNGRLNMTLVLEKFVAHFDELYGDRGAEFLEEDGGISFCISGRSSTAWEIIILRPAPGIWNARM